MQAGRQACPYMLLLRDFCFFQTIVDVCMMVVFLSKTTKFPVYGVWLAWLQRGSLTATKACV